GAQGHHLSGAWPVARLGRDHMPTGRPEAVLLARADDQVAPVRHRDVLALAVDVDVAGNALRSHCQVTADAVGAEAEITERLELAELDPGALPRLGGDRPRHRGRGLARCGGVEER